MDLLPAISDNGQEAYAGPGTEQTEQLLSNSFIEANTLETNLAEISERHLIPVFVKENVPTISQADFITHTLELVEEVSGHKGTNLQIKVSHPIKGRVFEARHKRADELQEWEKTLYYERMAFTAQVPEYREIVNGHELTLTFGGVKAYNLDNLYSNSHSIQRFKFFMGYTVRACTNLCISADGFIGDIKVRSITELRKSMYELLKRYDMVKHPINLQRWNEYELSGREVTQILGRARVYQHLPYETRKDLPELLLSDSQLNQVARGYVHNQDFHCENHGGISLWNFYNLFTEATKSSYIDTFLDRNVNCSNFVQGLSHSLETGHRNWFLN
jgi:hypothetical protein